MNKLPQDFIRNIKSYDAHPCADMIRGAITQQTFTFIHDYNILPHYGNPQYYEDSYEFDVIRNHIYNKLQVWAINEEDILRLCPEYVHFNSSLINGLLNEDAERLEQARIENEGETDSDYSESEEAMRYFTEEHF